MLSDCFVGSLFMFRDPRGQQSDSLADIGRLTSTTGHFVDHFGSHERRSWAFQTR